jgi:hypothetical protein
MSYFLKAPLLYATCFALSACAPVQPLTTTNLVAAIKVEDSKFDTHQTFVGRTFTLSNSYGLGMSDDASFFLRSFRDKKTGDVSDQLYVKVESSVGGWRHFRSASFEGGMHVVAQRIGSDVHCYRSSCTHTEIVGIDVSTEMMRKAATSGFSLRLNSQAGLHLILTFPADAVSAQMIATGRAQTPITSTEAKKTSS